MDESSVELIKGVCRAFYDSSIDHGWPHVERVLGYALRIARDEGLEVDPDVLSITVFLHDIGRFIGEPHAYYSALVAEELLREMGLPEETIMDIVNAIRNHSYSYSKTQRGGTRGRRALAAILSDADKLDAMGVIGFLRVFIYGYRYGRSIEESIRHFHEKILELDKHLELGSSKKIAECLLSRTRILLEMLEEELKQECSIPRE